jgi:predicted enzyme related to lactoylglutathione lyase
MKRVTGIGGVFFKSPDPKRLAEWYKVHLGLNIEAWGGGQFQASGGETTVWNAFKADTESFAPSAASFMINYRVADLYALLDALRAEGCQVLDKVDDSEYGKFGWVIDPDGNKVELWEPPVGQ